MGQPESEFRLRISNKGKKYLYSEMCMQTLSSQYLVALQFVDIARCLTEHCLAIHDGNWRFDHTGIVVQNIQITVVIEFFAGHLLLVFRIGLVEEILGPHLKHIKNIVPAVFADSGVFQIEFIDMLRYAVRHGTRLFLAVRMTVVQEPHFLWMQFHGPGVSVV
jgi:hypothetical protein